jgi:hypothetical protein
VLQDGAARDSIIASASDSAAPDVDSTADSPADELSCPPGPHPNRCAGDDSTYVFFPPLACVPGSPSEAGAPDAADDGSPGTGANGDAASEASADAGVADAGVCATVTTLDVFFTPQACRAFVAAEANGDIHEGDPEAPVIDEPVDGQMLTADNWSIFVWHQPARDSRRHPLRRALDLVEPSAYAYSPLSGVAYVLEFTRDCTEILRVMLAESIWLPDPASWAILTSLAGPVQVRVIAVRFAADALVSKPAISAPVTITMQGDTGG